MRVHLLLAIVVGVFMVCAAGTLCWPGGTMMHYVAPNGSDANDGSAGRPFATIQKAADAAKPGDTVIVRDGVYTAANSEGCAVVVECSGTAEQPITFRAEHKWRAVMDGRDDTAKYGWVLEQDARYVIIEGFEMKEFASHGITSNSGAQHITVRGCHIHHIGNVETTTHYGLDGIFDNSDTTYHTYDGNVFHDIGRTGPPEVLFNLDHGIYTCGKHNIITNNIFYNMNAGWGVQIAGYHTVDDLLVSNNVFAYGNKRGQIVLWQPCHNILIQNNIFYKPAVENAINFFEADLQNVIIRNNLVFGGGLKDNDDDGVCQLSDNIAGKDPLFANGARFDFHLKPGSPAIDAGIADRAPSTDTDGRKRPHGRGCDIGAYEF